MPTIIEDDLDVPSSRVNHIHSSPTEHHTPASPRGQQKQACQGTNFNQLRVDALHVSEILKHQMAHIYNDAGTKESIHSLLNGPMKEMWSQSVSISSTSWSRVEIARY